MSEVFMQLKRIKFSRKKDKIAIMRSSSLLKKVFKYTYDPFLRYQMKAPPLPKKMSISGGNDINDDTFDLLTKIAEREIKGTEALIAVVDHMRELTPNAADVLRRIINKRLNINTGFKVVMEVWPDIFPEREKKEKIVPVMLCRTFQADKVVYPCVLSPKKDGIRARYIDKKLYLGNGKVIKGMNHILKELRDFEYELDGEICISKNIFYKENDLSRHTKYFPDAIYYVFDIPFYPGTKIKRYQFLLASLKSSKIKVLPQHMINDFQELNIWYRRYLEEGEEGIVVCSNNHEYRDGHSWHWLKRTPTQTIDLLCIDFFEGTGKYTGKLGGIVVRNKGVKIKVTRGFSDIEREKIWNEKHNYFYKPKMVKITYKKIDKEGRLTQQRFVDWLPDKDNNKGFKA